MAQTNRITPSSRYSCQQEAALEQATTNLDYCAAMSRIMQNCPLDRPVVVLWQLQSMYVSAQRVITNIEGRRKA